MFDKIYKLLHGVLLLVLALNFAEAKSDLSDDEIKALSKKINSSVEIIGSLNANEINDFISSVHDSDSVIFPLSSTSSEDLKVLIEEYRQDNLWEYRNIEKILKDRVDKLNKMTEVNSNVHFSIKDRTILTNGYDSPPIIEILDCKDALCVEEGFGFIVRKGITLKPRDNCQDVMCMEGDDFYNGEVLVIDDNEICKYAICMQFHPSYIDPAEEKGVGIMFKPDECTDSECVDPYSKHTPDYVESEKEELRRKEEEEKAEDKDLVDKSKKDQEEAEKKLKEKKEKREEADRNRKEAESKEKQKKKKFHEASLNAAIAAKDLRRAKRNRSDDIKAKESDYKKASDAANTLRNEYDSARREAIEARAEQRRAVAMEEYARSEFEKKSQRYEWNKSGYKFKYWLRDVRDLCKAGANCKFRPIGLQN